MKKLIASLVLLLLVIVSYAQNVGIGTNTPHPSAKLEISSNNSGFLPPRMTTAERNTIASPAVGLQIYNLTTHCLEIFDFGKWNSVYCVPIDSTTIVDSTLLTDIDGHTYPTTQICNQTWMAKNLDVARYRNGDTIPQVTDPSQWANLTTGAWCWYNNDSATYSSVYGRLYNWYAVNDPRGLAPTGWHVPNDGEWNTLADCLGGADVAGGKMKEEGTAHWNSPNAGATNSSGFDGLPSGGRYESAEFVDIGTGGNFWSSSENSSNSASYYYLNYNYASLTYYNYSKGRALSVRCVKDTPITTLNNGLVAYYPFNGNANDESGNGNNGVVNGATLTTDRLGNSGKAYSFNGVDDQIEVSTTNGNFDNNSFSISFWLKTNQSGGDPAIISRTNNTGSVYNNFVIFENNGKSALNGSCVWTMGYQTTTQNTILGNNWKHVVAVSTPYTAAIYVNGILAKTDTVNTPSYMNFANFPIRFGRSKHPYWGDYSGSLDDIRIYNRALTQAEITYLTTQ
jgi:uncharacterized protein (TIGR02145 family)